MGQQAATAEMLSRADQIVPVCSWPAVTALSSSSRPGGGRKGTGERSDDRGELRIRPVIERSLNKSARRG